MKKILKPDEVLVAVISYYVNTECPEEFDAEITARFTDKKGTVEIIINEVKDEKKFIN